MSAPLLELRDLRRSVRLPSHEELHILRGIDLSVEAGDHVAIVGRSGSGKTTLLNLLGLIDHQTGGELLFDGLDVSRLGDRRRARLRGASIGFVFQQFNLLSSLSALQNVELPLIYRSAPKPERRERAREVLERVGLGDRLHNKPGELSGGQQQRVALGRALIYEPDLLLMDEPLGALDRNLREQMQQEIKRIQRELNATILYVTHDRDEAMSMSDRVCVMNAGEISQLDTPERIYHQPETEFVARFLGDANIFDGTVHEKLGDEYGVTLDSGQTVRVSSARAFAEGEQIQVMCRPEQTDIAATSEDAFVRIAISNVSYYGNCYRVAGTCIETGAQLMVETQRSDLPSVGSEVPLRWDHEAAVLLTGRGG